MYCINCGEKLSDDSKFCEKCGTPVEEEVEDKVEKKEKPKLTQEIKKLSDLDIAVADLKPDDFDELLPKSKNPRILIVIIVLIILAVLGYFYFGYDNDGKKTKPVETNYQTIIDEYGASIEKVAKEYLSDHELINDFSEIKDLVKYDKHNVSCDNVFVNIDGTVYLSDCSVDGKKVSEIYGKRKNILTKDQDEVCKATYNSEEGKLEFYVDNELISVYECEHGKCGLYTENEFKYNSCMDMIAVIEDGKYKLLYSYQSGQKILDELDEIAPVIDNDKYIGFIVKDSQTQKYGYVSTRGIIKLELNYDSLGLISDGVSYDRGIDIVNDKIIARKDGKSGVISLSTGNIIIPFEYDAVYLGEKNNYVIKTGKEYHLINSSGEKILSDYYDMIFAYDEFLIVNDSGKIKIIDYEENKIVDDELDVYVDYKDEPIGGIFGYNATKENDKILIEINKSSSTGYETEKYYYDIKGKKITSLEEE